MNESGTELVRAQGTSDNERIDFIVPAEGIYYIRVYFGNQGNQYDLRWDDIVVSVSEDRNKIPMDYSLSQNYPNPFNPETTIEYEIPKTTQVTIKIYNFMGQKIRTLVQEEKSPDHFQITWDGSDSHGNQVASGIYVYEDEDK